MPFEPLVTAMVETTLNTLIQDDPALVKRMTRLKGQVIQVHIKELDKTLTFIFSQHIDVLAQFEGNADCYLSLSLRVLPQLREQANITQLIKQDQLVLEGDIQLAQKFSQLLTDAKPDLEEWLSRVMGDVVAHTVFSSAKQSLAWAKTRVEKKQDHIAQILTEEWRIAPAPLEVAHFCDQVDDIASAVARSESHLNTLLEKA